MYPTVWPFKWQLPSSTFLLYFLHAVQVVLSLEFVDDILKCDHSSTEQCFPVVLFIMLYKMVLTFESVDEILECDHSNESYCAVLSQTNLLTSQTLQVLSIEQEAKKSPHECHEHPHTAWVWSVKVRIHSALEKSQTFTVPSPDEVARRAPL